MIIFKITLSCLIILSGLIMIFFPVTPGALHRKFAVDHEFEWKGHTYKIINKSESYIIVSDENDQKSTINLAEEKFSTLWSINVRRSDPFRFFLYETRPMSLVLVREPKFNQFDSVREIGGVTTGVVKAVYNKNGDICYDVHYYIGDGFVTVTGCAENTLEKVVR